MFFFSLSACVIYLNLEYLALLLVRKQKTTKKTVSAVFHVCHLVGLSLLNIENHVS